MRMLGVDIGASRVRVLDLALVDDSRIENAAVRDLPEGASTSGHIAQPDVVAEALRECMRELFPRRRRFARSIRCVASIADCDARIASVTLPPMSWAGRRSALALHSREIPGFNLAECIVTVEDRGQQALLGIARRAALESRVVALKRAGLMPLAIDHEALALSRAFPGETAIFDIGLDSARLIVAREHAPDVAVLGFGGAGITAGIARSRGTSQTQAEARKRAAGLELDVDVILGVGLAQLNERLTQYRKICDIPQVTLAGNGSRLQGLPQAIERATGVTARLASFDDALLARSALPAHVIAANACDWALAFGNALWPLAGRSKAA